MILSPYLIHSAIQSLGSRRFSIVAAAAKPVAAVRTAVATHNEIPGSCDGHQIECQVPVRKPQAG